MTNKTPVPDVNDSFLLSILEIILGWDTPQQVSPATNVEKPVMTQLPVLLPV